PVVTSSRQPVRAWMDRRASKCSQEFTPSPRRRAPLRSEPHNRTDAELDLLHEFAVEDHETAAELNGAAREPADRRFDDDREPLRFGTNSEPGAEELLEAGAEAQREAGQPATSTAEARPPEERGWVPPRLPGKNDRSPFTSRISDSRVKSA